MKNGGGGGGRLALRGLRFESQRFRLLSIVVGCFLISATFLLSSRPEATVFHTLSPRESLQAARTPAMKTARPSSGLGRDFLVDVLPRQGGEQAGHGDGELRQSADRSSDKTEWIKDTVIIEERVAGGENAAAAAERWQNAAAGTGDPGDGAAPGGDGEKMLQGNAVQTTAAAATTQPEPAVEPRRAGEKEQVGGGQIELRAAESAEKPPERKETPRSVDLQPQCNFSDVRTDVCDLAGDVRLDANASAFVVVVGDPAAAGKSHRVRPYPRKGDATCMGRIVEIAMRTTADAAAAPRCTAAHDSPAVVFSIGGYTGNIFHDFSDVLVPLFNTVRRHAGDVQLVLADVASWWLVKYGVLLRELSRHPPLDLAKAGAAGEVHCFRRAAVGLRAHRELIVQPERSPDGLATPDFTRFLRRALALPRDAPTRPSSSAGAAKPRLVIISRGRTRLLVNLAGVVRLAEEVGFEAVVSESDVGSDIREVGRVINSGDVLVGVHGAGLTNMLFLPEGAAMVQVVPWGGLQWVARMDYGEPAEAMGLKYIQYEVAVGESSLKDKYPPGHEIFTNPTALHKKGFGFMRKTLMDGQDITLDLGRFRAVLLQALSHLAQ